MNASGFSLIEVVATVAVLGIAAVMTTSFLVSWKPRLDLRGTVGQAQFLIGKARLEAIQRGVHVVVQADLQAGLLVAFADVNGDPVAGNPGYPNYLKYDPDPALADKHSDYEVGLLVLEGSSFCVPPACDPVDGFTSVPGAPAGTPSVLVFSPAGVPVAIGALRFTDGARRNVLEAAVTSLAGKVEIRKFLREEDSPTSTAGFFPEGVGGDGANVWVWY